jgi:hypothetical protein
VRDVRVLVAAGCHLCEAALEIVEPVCRAAGVPFEVVDISGEHALEARYRERIPVVEIDGEEAFALFVDPDALRERLGG